MNTLLPEDLVCFLDRRDKLEYDTAMAVPGRVALHKLEKLRIGRLYAAARKSGDPNRGRSGVYRIPAISLLARCEKYDPAYLLCYLPLERSFAAFDGDHALPGLFAGATWSDIVANPLPYLNAPWDRKSTVKIKRNTDWGARYAFFRGACE